MLRQLTWTLAALAALGTPAAAQQAPRAVTVVEILGLRRWTARMVEDSVARFQPGITLADHACAVILRDSVGFADAAVQTFMWNDTTWAVLSVVEPDMKDRVRFRSYTVDHLGARNPFTRPTAHRFLVHIHGADLGWDPSVWRPWLER